MRRTRLMLIIGVGVLALVAAACSSDGDSDDSGTVSIDSFDVPDSADCSGGEQGTVEVSWETTDATEVEISVDGDQVASGPDPSGSDMVDVPCDGEDHDIELTAMDGDGKSASQTETVSTEAGSGGGGATTSGGSGGTTTTTTGGTTTTTGGTTSTTGGSTPTQPSAPTGQNAQ